MNNDVKRIDAKEFREIGFLQEVNRQFLHPLGLALEIQIDDDDNETIGGVWDYRDDPEGMFFADGMIDADKIARVEELRKSKEAKRIEVEGSVVQK
jgi:hypothetical protein